METCLIAPVFVILFIICVNVPSDASIGADTKHLSFSNVDLSDFDGTVVLNDDSELHHRVIRGTGKRRNRGRGNANKKKSKKKTTPRPRPPPPTRKPEPEPEPGCDGTPHKVTELFGLIKSPNYGGKYPAPSYCQWDIVALEGQVVTLTFLEFDLEYQSSCLYDSLTVLDSDHSELGRFCGSNIPQKLVSKGNTMYIQFDADNHVTKDKGFKIRYGLDHTRSAKSVLHCGETKILEASEGLITSPSYPGMYPNNLNCSWHIRLDRREVVLLSFTDFLLERTDDCSSDRVEVYDGPDEQSPFLGRFCGSEVDDDIFSTSNNLFVKFVSDNQVRKRGFKAEYARKFRSRSASSPGPTVANCGLPQIKPKLTGRTIGGEEVKPNSWPWVVQVRLRHPMFGWTHWCGATLITPDWAVTAAHCTYDTAPNGQPMDFTQARHLKRWMLVTGEHNLDQEEGSEVRHKALEIIRHENHNNKTYHNDVALIKIDPPAEINKYVQTICMPDKCLDNLVMGFAAGWGTTDPFGQMSSIILNQVNVPRLDNTLCNSTSFYNGAIKPGMMCAGYPEGLKDSCQGDSGGPLFSRNSADNRYHLYGIVSWGFGCAKAKKPGVYAEVCYYKTWIAQHIGLDIQEEGCGSPFVPSDGTIEGTNFTEGAVVNYKCNEGYTIEGATSTTCNNGSWSGETPVCNIVTCADPGTPSNGQREGNDTSFGETVTYTCDTGYTLIGEATIECDPEGEWSHPPPQCQVKTCNPLSAPTNGEITGEEFTFGSIVSFSCNIGFTLSGLSTVTCGGDGWDTPAPYCQAIKCEVPVAPENGNISGSDYSFGASISYVCDPGYTLEGNSVSTCTESGWSGDRPICNLVDCGEPTSLANGRYYLTNHTIGGIVLFICNPRYTLQGPVIRICEQNGWNDEMPECTRLHCPELIPPNNGQISGQGNTIGSFRSFTCNEGYELFIGSPFVVCEKKSGNAQWSNEVPQCREETCGEPDVPSNGLLLSVDLVLGGETKYSCNTGYNITGDNTLTCVAGLWDGQIPTCDIVKCKDPGSPEHGEKRGDDFSFGAAVEFSCEEYYTLTGAAEITCQADGTWSDETPQCSLPAGHLSMAPFYISEPLKSMIEKRYHQDALDRIMHFRAGWPVQTGRRTRFQVSREPSLSSKQSRWWKDLMAQKKIRRTKRGTGRRVLQRKEYRTLNMEEREALHRALWKTKTRMIDGISEYDIFLMIHDPLTAPAAHLGAAFLPWHREVLFRFELILQAHNNSVTLPYIDWTLDSRLPEPRDSIIWSDRFLGDSHGKVTSGPFRYWPVLSKCHNSGITLERAPADKGVALKEALINDFDMEYVMNKTSFGQLVVPPYLEWTLAGPQVFVGGHFADVKCAPSDPLFWMHQSFADCVWQEFRNNHQQTQQELEYPTHSSSTNIGGPAHNPNAEMSPFKHLRNLNGLENFYTDYFYKCADRPKSCTSSAECGPYLFCHQRRCMSKVKVDGNCTGFTEGSTEPCECGSCTGGRCTVDDSNTWQSCFPQPWHL